MTAVRAQSQDLGMARHEVPVLTDVVFRDPQGTEIPEGEYRVVVFAGHEIAWCVNPSDPERGRMLPTVTMRSADRLDKSAYHAEVLVLQRFFSALAFALDVAIIPIVFGRQERPVDPGDWITSRQPGWPLPLIRACGMPGELAVNPDPDLALVLALRREGRNSFSPFHRFLAYWNALDLVFDRDPTRRDRFIAKSPRRARAWFHGWDPMPTNLVQHFASSNRNAIAHAIPDGEASILDPDDAADFQRLRRDTRALDNMLRLAIEERWPYPVSAYPAR